MDDIMRDEQTDTRLALYAYGCGRSLLLGLQYSLLLLIRVSFCVAFDMHGAVASRPQA